MKPRHRRIFFVSLAVAGVGIAAVMVTMALRSNIAYFFTPTQVKAGEVEVGRVFRLGGMVQEGSLKRVGKSVDVEFIVGDNANTVKVVHQGILPDLFKEGQGMVAKGRLREDGVFIADEVLAKHDENYLPPEVADSMKKTQ